ncbi:alanine racemase [Metabacillus fastidiosus]|uniref:alanine racemase n=1 Tax=Metabacillus fastidiosus TaxID=1458 RepID=UPI000A4EBC74
MAMSFHRDTWAEINLDAISHNVKSMKKHIGANVKLIAVVKANAYGHGDFQVAKAAISAGAEQLAVAFLDEAIALRTLGITLPILVLGATRSEDAQLAIEYDLTLTCFSKDWLDDAKQNIRQGQLKLHLKVDTGMGRIGVTKEEELNEILVFLNSNPRFKLLGVYTHFSTADEIETDYFKLQYERFTNMIRLIPDDNIQIHCANSATGLRFPDHAFNAVRFGIAMYGLTPSLDIVDELPFPLEEAFSLHSKLTHVKKVPKGTKVSYGATYEAGDDEWIGTIPIGYADGWIRRLSGSEVLVDGERVPIIGRICMDQLMVKLPSEKPVGTKVTFIGKQGNEFISVDEIAKRLETINYEVTCSITSRVPRLFLQNGSIIEVRNPLLINAATIC